MKAPSRLEDSAAWRATLRLLAGGFLPLANLNDSREVKVMSFGEKWPIRARPESYTPVRWYTYTGKVAETVSAYLTAQAVREDT